MDTVRLTWAILEKLEECLIDLEDNLSLVEKKEKMYLWLEKGRSEIQGNQVHE